MKENNLDLPGEQVVDSPRQRTIMKKQFLASLVFCAALLGQTYQVGEVVSNFTVPLCANGTGNFVLNNYNGDVNGGNYHVLWIICFATW